MELDKILEKLESGEITLSRLEKKLGNANLAALVRRLFLERKYGIGLSGIASTIIDFEDVFGRNIENPIGAVQVPVGVVGPLLVKGTYARGEYYVPLATTEGALVA
ncbi:MAG: 3-hydroxy-3-methylglutaryl-CoA reductase, partial [Desulfurococcales archaeon]|nr:3-hydroxy-3-methylglutaryl-CoA reductase [Desulfurococcales archaeon]